MSPHDEDESRDHLPDGTLVDDWIAAHPDGGTYAEVGAALGLTKQRIQQIERVAMRTLASRLIARLGRDIERGERLSDHERLARTVRRMRDGGADVHEIAELLNVPEWRIQHVIHSRSSL